jgi:hypothetical protein
VPHHMNGVSGSDWLESGRVLIWLHANTLITTPSPSDRLESNFFEQHFF